MGVYRIYTDGACSQNKTWKGGWGVVVLNDKNEIVRKMNGSADNTTNSRMEIQAVLEGIKSIEEPSTITIVSDSQYVCNTINIWLDGWLKNGSSSSKANTDQWDEFLELRKKHNITAEHIRGHRGNYYNEIADKLAVAGVKGDIYGN